jgi:hypothetical protein
MIMDTRLMLQVREVPSIDLYGLWLYIEAALPMDGYRRWMIPTGGTHGFDGAKTWLSMVDSSTRDRVLRLLADMKGLEPECGSPGWCYWDSDWCVGGPVKGWVLGFRAQMPVWWSVHHLDPRDDTRLQDGSRRVAALALADVARRECAPYQQNLVHSHGERAMSKKRVILIITEDPDSVEVRMVRPETLLRGHRYDAVITADTLPSIVVDDLGPPREVSSADIEKMKRWWERDVLPAQRRFVQEYQQEPFIQKEGDDG